MFTSTQFAIDDQFDHSVVNDGLAILYNVPIGNDRKFENGVWT
jgi:hypothetical protein